VSTPYYWHHAPIVTVDSRFFRGRLSITETKAMLPDGTVVAYFRDYSYAPQGSAMWIGGSSGSSPLIRCEIANRFPKLEDMFPPMDEKLRSAP
jgi:hypothetical protein